MSALLVLTVLAGLAAWAATLSSVQHANALLGPLSARAHYAARSGLEWAAWQVLANGATGLACPGTTTFELVEAALAGFEVSVGCTATWPGEVARGHPRYSLVVSASRGTDGGMDRVSHTLHADITR